MDDATQVQPPEVSPLPASDGQPAAFPLTIRSVEDGLLAEWSIKPKQVWTNIQPATEEGKALLTRVMVKGDVDKDRAVDKAFLATHYAAHPVEHVNPQTGEVKPGHRIVLVGPKGETLDTCSGPVLDGLRAVLAAYGQGPWEPPLKIRFRKVPSRNHPGGNYYVCYAEPRELKDQQAKKA